MERIAQGQACSIVSGYNVWKNIHISFLLIVNLFKNWKEWHSTFSCITYRNIFFLIIALELFKKHYLSCLFIYLFACNWLIDRLIDWFCLRVTFLNVIFAENSSVWPYSWGNLLPDFCEERCLWVVWQMDALLLLLLLLLPLPFRRPLVTKEWTALAGEACRVSPRKDGPLGDQVGDDTSFRNFKTNLFVCLPRLWRHWQ